MICLSYDPITSSCAPSCCVCSNREPCALEKYNQLTPQNQQLVQDKTAELLEAQRAEALREEAFNLIMELNPEERHELLTRWQKRIASRNTADQSTLQEAI